MVICGSLRGKPSTPEARPFRSYAKSKAMPLGKTSRTAKATGTINTGTMLRKKNADKGVALNNGSGLVKLGSWLAGKHEEYIKPMERIQKVIAAVMIAEKQERTKRRQVDKATLGYDPKLWIKANAHIGNSDESHVDFQSIKLPPPVHGKHRFDHCLSLIHI